MSSKQMVVARGACAAMALCVFAAACPSFALDLWPKKAAVHCCKSEGGMLWHSEDLETTRSR